MATDIVVPALGESVTEATVAQWLKQPGDAVAVDEAVVELETDKVTLEVNAAEAGVLEEVIAAEGANVEVGAVLGRIVADGDAAKAVSKSTGKTSKDSKPASASQEETPQKEPSVAEAPTATENGQPIEIVVPALGESVTEATVAQWLKKSGEAVAADEALVELETDKVTLEVNAPADGVIGEIMVGEGDTVEVGAVLGVLSAGGVPASEPTKPSAETSTQTPATEVTKPEPSGEAAPSVPQPAKRDALGGADPASVRRSGSGEKISKADLIAFLNDASLGDLGPAVRKMVVEKGLDPAVIPPTGRDGRLTKEDVLNYLEGHSKTAQPTAAPAPSAAKTSDETKPPASGGPREERVRMSKLRQTIARRLKEAQNTAAMLTTFNECDMSAVMALRIEYKETFAKKHDVKLGFMSFFTKAVIAALQELPAVNARIEGEEIVYNHYYNIGMAVSTPSGLMVPVLRDCDRMTFSEIEKELGALAAKGRDGKLGLDEMSGGTFTITNGGVFGSLLSTPILNMPQAAILGLHKIQERPVVIDSDVKVRPMMYLALSYDHRIIDGREAVTFLVRVKENIEDPRRLILGM